MNRYPVWQRLGPKLTAVLTAAVHKGYVTGADIRLLVPKRSSPAWKMAQKWIKRGWLERTDRDAVYRPSRNGIEKVAEMEHADFGGFDPKGGAIERVWRLIDRRGAVSCEMIARLLRIKQSSARNAASRWKAKGLLRSTHRDTYRRPLAAGRLLRSTGECPANLSED